MRIHSFVLSLLVHALIFSAALWMPLRTAHEPPIDLQQQVHEVELVRSAVQEESEPAQPEEEVPVEPQDPQEVEEPQQREQPVREAARDPRDSESKQLPAQDSPAPEEPESREQPRASPEAPESPEAEEESRQEPEARQAPSGERLLAQALEEVEQDLDTGQAEREREIVARELESLREEMSGQDSVAGDVGERELYASIVEERVKQNWRFPAVAEGQNLVARARVRIQETGEIEGYSLESGSGRRDFDDSVLRAIEDTERLPQPPIEGLREITITFNLQEQRG